jgi:hypothetical protein
MPEKQRDEDRGAQQQGALERHAEENPANHQDLNAPPEGRDVPPENTKRPARSRQSPWMGGG